MVGFKVNEYITLKLEKGETIIYIKDKIFTQCKKLLLKITENERKITKNIQTLDEIVDVLDQPSVNNKTIPPEVEFWGHCSNLQVFAENNYDTQLIYHNLAFYLLKELVKAGDIKAKKVFRKEIAKRIESGYGPVIQFLIEERYIDELPEDYVNNLVHSKTFLMKLFSETRMRKDFKMFCKTYIKYINAINEKKRYDINLKELVSIYDEIYGLDYNQENETFYDYNDIIFLWHKLKSNLNIDKIILGSEIIMELFELFDNINEFRFILNNSKINKDLILPIMFNGFERNSLPKELFHQEIEKRLNSNLLYSIINLMICALKYSNNVKLRTYVLNTIIKIFEIENLSSASQVIRIKSLQFLRRNELLLLFNKPKLKLFYKLLDPLTQEINYDLYKGNFNELNEYSYYETLELVSVLFKHVEDYLSIETKNKVIEFFKNTV